MIHGLMGSLDFFEPARRLHGVSVHTPELIGYGALAGDRVTALTLSRQADHVADYIAGKVDDGPSWVLGHSVGGAIAVILARRHPALVAGLISVEGNFTLDDAFWCRRIAAMAPEEWDTELAEMRADPVGWLTHNRIAATPERIVWARRILDHQSSRTIRQMAEAVVRETGAEAYLEGLRTALEAGLPIQLVAGDRSLAGWNVPTWVSSAAHDFVVQPNVGHLMMLEDPEGFCAIVDRLLERARQREPSQS